MSERKIAGLPFQYICEIVPACHADGRPKEFMPQRGYKNSRNLPLHEYGQGPFCRYRIPNELNLKVGVYAILVDGQSRYVGETDNLGHRFNAGYGNTSPRNCFQGGQSTNCRVNNLILNAYKEGSSIWLLFHETADRFSIEATVLAALRPRWNLIAGRSKAMRRPLSLRSSTGPSRAQYAYSPPSGKYRPLFDYLTESHNESETLTFAQIEGILGLSLPPSAHEYRQWWGNGHHSQASAWLAAGWKVARVVLGGKVTFERSRGLSKSQ